MRGWVCKSISLISAATKKTAFEIRTCNNATLYVHFDMCIFCIGTFCSCKGTERHLHTRMSICKRKKRKTSALHVSMCTHTVHVHVHFRLALFIHVEILTHEDFAHVLVHMFSNMSAVARVASYLRFISSCKNAGSPAPSRCPGSLAN